MTSQVKRTQVIREIVDRTRILEQAKNPMTEKKIQYPAEVTFKAVFKNAGDIKTHLEGLLSGRGIEASLSCRTSRNGKFASYTVTAVFSSDSELKKTCEKIAEIKDFMMMF